VNATRALRTIWGVLTRAQRRRFVVLQVVAVFMAMSTVIGLGAVMTFLAVLTDPALIEAHAALNWLQHMAGTKRDFILVLGSAFILLLILSAVLNLFGMRAMGRFAHAVGDRIREVLFSDYLRREYLFHARVGSGQLMDDVLYQADRVTNTLLNAQLLITNGVLTLLVVVSIAIVNPMIAMLGVTTVAGSYLLFYRIMRQRVGRNGRLLPRLGAERTAVVEQALHGIKYLLIARAQNSFDKRFQSVTRTLSQSLADTNFIGQSPKYLLECVAGAALIASAALAAGGAVGGAWLAQLTFIGFAGFRLLPAGQQMYHAFVVIRANRATIENLASQLEHRSAARAEPAGTAARPMPFRSIGLSGVSFRYSPETPWVLADVSLRIDAGAAVGIVGPSGGGKTTLVDLLVGLMSPTSGRIEIDGETLDPQRVDAWQQGIGYVPQEVMILDATVRENIAFGVDPGEIDDERVRAAAKQAGAAAFIESLPGGFLARTSGLGGSLSGGQRQRLGIARALYRNPSLLVLDEATNSLDADTERAIVDTVVRNRGSRTLVIVAHGDSVIGACDRVYEMRNGRLHERGSSPVRLRGVE
jgi:ABC-type multidrug transport system fused ATPase/permease subunit